MARLQQKTSGKRVRGKGGACEALPAGGVMAVDKGATEALKKKGVYKTMKWNRFGERGKSLRDHRGRKVRAGL